MSKNYNSSRSPNHQALISDIYANLIPLVLRRGKASLSLNEADSRPWLDTDTYMKSVTVKPNGLIVSAAEARAKSAICNKLRKLDTDGRHELVTSFLINKLIPLLDARENADWNWVSNKGTIVRIFENDLIDQYRKANTKQSRFEKSIVSMGCELDKAITTYDNQNITAHEAELIAEENLMSTSAAFHAYCQTLRELDRLLLEASLLKGMTSEEIAKIIDWDPSSVRHRKKKLMDTFRATLSSNEGN